MNDFVPIYKTPYNDNINKSKNINCDEFKATYKIRKNVDNVISNNNRDDKFKFRSRVIYKTWKTDSFSTK